MINASRELVNIQGCSATIRFLRCYTFPREANGEFCIRSRWLFSIPLVQGSVALLQ